MATPSPPTNVSITKVSNTKVRVTWSGIRGTIQLLRRATPGSGTAAWEEYGLWTGPVDSGHELTIPAGYEYRAQVRSVDLWNPSNMSGSVWSSSIARCFDKPPVPSSVSLARNADNKRTTTIGSAAPPASQPILETWVERWTIATGAYGGRIVSSGQLGAVVDTANLPNERVRTRACFANAAGNSAWVESTGWIRNTPAAPTSVTATRSNSSDALVTAVNKARAATSIDILGASSTDGVTWTAPAVVAGHSGITPPGLNGTLQRTIVAPDPAKQWRYTVRVNATENGVTLSALSPVSAAVKPLAPPAAPTLVGPVPIQSTGLPVRLEWRHNALDTSGQTSAVVDWWPEGDPGAWTTTTVTGSQQYALLPALVAGRYVWRVQTYGVHPSPGPFSAEGVFEVAAPPSSTITSPADGTTLHTNRLAIGVDWSDAKGAAMTGWRRRLYQGADLLEDRTGTGTVTTSLFATPLKNETTYRAEWVATSGTGLSSAVASVEVTTAFTPPFVPEAFGVVWVEDEALARVAAAAGGLSTAWAGTKDRSVSIEYRDGIETRRNLATNPRFVDTYQTVTIPAHAGGGTAPGVAAINTDGSFPIARVSTRLSAVAWAADGGMRLAPPADGTSQPYSVYPANIGAVNGDGMRRAGLVPGRCYAMAVRYAQDSEYPGPWSGTARCIGWTYAVGGVVSAWYTSLSEVAPNEAGSTVLTTTCTIPEDASEWAPILCYGGGTGSCLWSDLIICEGATEEEALARVQDWFDGDTLGARTSSVASRIERSDDDGQTWTTVVDAPSPVASADDVRAPLNRVAWYRVVAVSALGVEATTAPVQVATPCGDVWLEGEDGRRARIRTNLRLAKGWAQEAVAPVYYGQAYGESHYGDGRTDDVTVTGTLIAGEGLEQDLASLLRGQDVYYRDPRGAAWWAQLAGRLTDDSDWIERTEISVPLTRVLGGDDES